MKEFILRRRYFVHGTFGTLELPDGTSLVTIECPWQNNQRNISCIPAGEYEMQKHKSPHNGNRISITSDTLGVTRYGPSQRSHILMHKANLVESLEGCIAPGVRFGVIAGQWAVIDSEVAMNKIMYLMGRDSGALVIS